MTATTDMMIECSGVSVGHGTPILERVDLRIHRGEIVVFLGSSGSGKSTLMRSLVGLLPPIGGEVRMFGESIYDISNDEREALLRRTGMVFQHDALFGSMTVGDNVAMPLRESGKMPEAMVRELVRVQLAMFGLSGMEDRPPDTLSGGERKRAALARAAVHDPEIVFGDEPSAGLDPSVGATVDEALLRLRDTFGTTIVIVTHEMESVKRIADRIVMFGKGGVTAKGTFEELEQSHDDDIFNFFHRVAAPVERVHARGQQ
ncbi:MAG TPA: ATP-binding cassette domain-containing protein [Kofleriaceae bacterium]|jgi:phospholipid/cholesterol/gamma-HCH transport system ATP-binding protein|nr:ATP-binding cassette domain-containing protein [Kofleriaceae bacterium]